MKSAQNIVGVMAWMLNLRPRAFNAKSCRGLQNRGPNANTLTIAAGGDMTRLLRIGRKNGPRPLPSRTLWRPFADSHRLCQWWHNQCSAAIFFSKSLTTATRLHIREVSWDRGRLARRCHPGNRWYSIARGCSRYGSRLEGHNFWPHPNQCGHNAALHACRRRSVPSGKLSASILPGVVIMTLSASATIAFAAPSTSTAIHLTTAQEKSLNIKTVRLKTMAIRPLLTLYGELKTNPDHVWMLSSPLAGVVLNMPGKQWPQIGAAVIRGSSFAGIKPAVSTTLEITLALELTKVKADLAAARVAQATSTAMYVREKSLYAQNKAVSLQQVQAAQSALADAQARVRADEQSIVAIAHQLKTKTGGFLPLPIFQNGIITQVLAHPGEAVAANQPLLKIVNFHTLVAAVALPASDSGKVAMETEIRVRALGHQHWIRAKPLTLAPRADRQTRGLSVLYLIDNPGALRPGMAITALMPKAAKAVAMTIIPRTAVIWWRGERWIYTARSGGLFAMHELINPETVPEGYAEKTGFLPARDIVIKGAQLLLTIKLSSTIKKSG